MALHSSSIMGTQRRKSSREGSRTAVGVVSTYGRTMQSTISSPSAYALRSWVALSKRMLKGS